MTNIEDLRARLKVLLGLLEDAHPGLSTWHEGYERAAANVLSFWGYGVANVSLLPAATQEQPAGSKLPQSFDARDWAKEFTEICATKGIVIEQDWMETWFANAIMAGYDHAHGGSPRKVGEDGAHNELSLVRLVLSAHQTAYAKFHNGEGRGVIEADQMAIGYASVELAKALRSSSVPVGEQKQEEGV